MASATTHRYWEFADAATRRAQGRNQFIVMHQYMSHENPRILFLHYWGKAKAADLAQAFKRVLDARWR